jgi:ribosome-binding protein aMBF1 (putative translation factor)
MEDEGWTTITAKKKTVSKKAPVAEREVQTTERQFAAVEHRAEEGSLRQKRVDTVSIAELVKARLAVGWTQEAADAACAMPKNTFKKIESGQLVPLGGYLRSISRTLKVNLRLIHA